ncbi:MAG: glutamine--fructose-6-phosphate transaminase (isomerizing) [Gemmatimonadota bacterium]
MCGIVGYAGSKQATDVLVRGLHRLEYRGYDSAGVAVQNGRGLETRKVAGRVDQLADLIERHPIHGSSGIGHTRWATHGAPTRRNAHPHYGCHEDIALVHNGIIENAGALRSMLARRGHKFRTDTDTEVLVHLIEEAGGDTLEVRVAAALDRVVGTYGMAAMWDREPGKIVAARSGAPVLLGIGEGEFFVASDPAAVLEHTRAVVYLEEGDIAVVTPAGYSVIGRDSEVRVRAVKEIEWLPEAMERGEYPHFMLKEIYEQPATIRTTMQGHVLEGGQARLNGLNLTDDDCRRFRRIVVLACGTSWHAGLVGRQLVEELAGIPVQVEYASEYRYQPHVGLEDALVIAISQSGETADTLEAMRAAKENGARVLGLVNVVGSTIARESQGGLYLHAGPEIGVASTKAFTSQLTALVLVAVRLGRVRGLDASRAKQLMDALVGIPDLVARALLLDTEVKEIAKVYANARNFLYLGRGVNYPVALEGALKLKEISYIHAEGLPAAEMKHGTIALIDENMPVVVVAPSDGVYDKVVSNIQEVKARGGRVIMVATEGNGDLRDLVDHQILVPETEWLLTPLLTVIPLQLLAYHIAVMRGCDVDRPRNLAKSVTVE